MVILIISIVLLSIFVLIAEIWSMKDPGVPIEPPIEKQKIINEESKNRIQ